MNVCVQNEVVVIFIGLSAIIEKTPALIYQTRQKFGCVVIFALINLEMWVQYTYSCQRGLSVQRESDSVRLDLTPEHPTYDAPYKQLCFQNYVEQHKLQLLSSLFFFFI